MGYVEQNLLPNEQVVVKAEHHVAAFFGPAIDVVIGFMLINAGGFLAFFGFILLLIGGWIAVKVGVAFLTNEMALTDKRMIGKAGFIRRDSLDVRNGFVSGIKVDQSIFGRILNYGTVIVRGADNVGFRYIKDPQKFRNSVQGHLAEMA